MNSVGGLDAYVDGADEIDRHMYMIKGGGAALTREKSWRLSRKIRMYRR